MPAALEVLGAMVSVDVEEHLFGGASIDAYGTALTDEVLAGAAKADAVLLPPSVAEMDTTDAAKRVPSRACWDCARTWAVRELRPVRALPALHSASPLREERIAGTTCCGA